MADENEDKTGEEAEEKKAGEDAGGEDGKAGEEEGKGGEEKKRNRWSVQDRINAERRRRGDAEREAAELRQRLEALEKRVPEEKVPDEPDPDDFGDAKEFRAEYRKWAQKKAEADAVAMAEQRFRDREAEARKRENEISRQRVAAEWAAKRREAGKKWEGWEDMEQDVIDAVQAHSPDPGNVFGDILESVSGPEIVYYLHEHPDELDELVSLQPRAATRFVGRLEARLNGSQRKKEPPPTKKTIKASAKPGKDVGSLTTEEYIRKMNFG